jgi:hypothetical protein
MASLLTHWHPSTAPHPFLGSKLRPIPYLGITIFVAGYFDTMSDIDILTDTLPDFCQTKYVHVLGASCQW